MIKIVVIIISILGLVGSILYLVLCENGIIGYQMLKYLDFAPIVGVLSLVILCFASSFEKKKK